MARGMAWDSDSRIQAAIAWLITGDVDNASQLCNVPSRTIRDWMTKEWWEDILSEAQGIKQKELDAVYTALIHKTTTALRDRIENGNVIVTKAGAFSRVPVPAKDLAVITAIISDKRALLRGLPTSRTEKITIEEKLEKLGQKLEDINQNQKLQ